MGLRIFSGKTDFTAKSVAWFSSPSCGGISSRGAWFQEAFIRIVAPAGGADVFLDLPEPPDYLNGAGAFVGLSQASKELPASGLVVEHQLFLD